MKKPLVNVLTKFGFLSVFALVTAVGSAQGQSLAYRLRVNIPFDFVVADKKLPAGEYSIGRAIPASGDGILLISSVDGHGNAVRWSMPVESRFSTGKGRLVFHRYGEQYFLSQVWPAGARTGRELVRSRSELELAAKSSAGKMSAKTQAAETVNIVVDLK